MIIFLIILLGVGYLWVYRFESLPSGEAGNDVFVWGCWAHRVCVLTDNGEAIEWRCDNTMEIDGSSSNTNSGVSIRKHMRDAI